MLGEREGYRVPSIGVGERGNIPRRVIQGKPMIQGMPIAPTKKTAGVCITQTPATKQKVRQRLPNRTLLILALPFLAMLLWSLNAVYIQGSDYQEARVEYMALRELAGPRRNESPQEVLLTPNEGSYQGEDVGIDWDALHAINPDIVGWIVVPSTTIDYPIVQGRDNSWYLQHTFRGERNPAGAIFADYLNTSDFSDGHMLVYGHNMQRGNMFAPLHAWDGEQFRIYTPGGVLEYEVFARQTVSRNNPLYSTFESPRDDGLQVVTLSTCTFRRPAYRFVIQGVRII